MTGERRRDGWLLFGPTLLLLAWVILPLARGSDTLYLRDVFATHLPMKHAQAEAMHQGRLPLLDPYRAGGQPLAGNPNAVALYPDNLLYLAASTLWAFNAHFWLHLLLAGPAMYLLGRAWGLSVRGSWAAGVVWVTSGYFLSQMNFYNLVAGVALAPALVASLLRLGERRPRGGALPWAAVLAGWMLLAGDPLTALLAGLAGLGALLCRQVGRTKPEAGDDDRASAGRLLLRLAGVLVLGLLVAGPQIYETRRILAGSFRGAYGFSQKAATAASWDPRQLVEWLLPLPFGRIDLLGEGSFWGHAFHGGFPPFYLALYPGLLALGLIVVSGRPRTRVALWAWLAVALGVFLALGRLNPVAAWVFSLPGLRYPVKAWLWVGLGASILAGLGFERAFNFEHVFKNPGGSRAGRRLWITLAASAVLLLAGWGFLQGLPGSSLPWLRGLIPANRPDGFVLAEATRLAGLCRSTAGIAGLLALVAWASTRRAHAGALRAGAVATLALHAGTQLALLHPLLAMDAAAPYRQPSPLAASVPAAAVLAHGGFSNLFGPSQLANGRFPEPSARWLTRRAIYELLPPAGALLDRRYLLNPSPEGLDAFQTRVAQAAVAASDDTLRIRLLAASGADLLLLNRELPAEALAAGADLVERFPSFGGELDLYALRNPVPAASILGRVWHVRDFDGAFARLTDPAFDPRLEGVVQGPGADRDAPAGTLAALREDAESVSVEVGAPAGGLLLLRRAYLPLYRAWIDGREVRPVPANLHLLGIEVPPGYHRVMVGVDRRALVVGVPAASLLTFFLLLLSLRRGPRPAPPPSPALDSPPPHGDETEDRESPDREPR